MTNFQRLLLTLEILDTTQPKSIWNRDLKNMAQKRPKTNLLEVLFLAVIMTLLFSIFFLKLGE